MSNMKIQFNTDNNVDGNLQVTNPMEAQITNKLARYSPHITRIEVHLTDVDGSKNGVQTKRCLMEARIKDRQPTIVTSQADTEEQALNAAIDKMRASLETILGKLNRK